MPSIQENNADVYGGRRRRPLTECTGSMSAFGSIAGDADHNIVVLAGHDAIQCLERRYDFELRTPREVSPETTESFGDIVCLIDVIENHDTHTVLYYPFEAPDPDTDKLHMGDMMGVRTCLARGAGSLWPMAWHRCSRFVIPWIRRQPVDRLVDTVIRRRTRKIATDVHSWSSVLCCSASPDGCRRPLPLPTLKIRRFQRLSEQFLVEHRHRNQRTARFSTWPN